jgi:hypothetical protein
MYNKVWWYYYIGCYVPSGSLYDKTISIGTLAGLNTTPVSHSHLTVLTYLSYMYWHWILMRIYVWQCWMVLYICCCVLSGTLYDSTISVGPPAGQNTTPVSHSHFTVFTYLSDLYRHRSPMQIYVWKGLMILVYFLLGGEWDSVWQHYFCWISGRTKYYSGKSFPPYHSHILVIHVTVLDSSADTCITKFDGITILAAMFPVGVCMIRLFPLELQLDQIPLR